MFDKLLHILARLMFAVPMGYFGIHDVLDAKSNTDIVPSYFPFPIIWVYIVGLSLIAASIGIIIHQFAKWAYAGLSLLLFIITMTVWYPKINGGGSIHFMSDLALTGAAFYMFLKEKR
jgi:uncharacterized membrane protein